MTMEASEISMQDHSRSISWRAYKDDSDNSEYEYGLALFCRLFSLNSGIFRLFPRRSCF